MGALAQHTGFEIYCNAAQLLSAPERIFSFNLGTSSSVAQSGAAKLAARRGGTLHGLFAFFTAELARGGVDQQLAARP
jgi:hypothetical protein